MANQRFPVREFAFDEEGNEVTIFRMDCNPRKAAVRATEPIDPSAFWLYPDWDGPLKEPFWMRPLKAPTDFENEINFNGMPQVSGSPIPVEWGTSRRAGFAYMRP
jgi:hypothetical protein